MRRLTLVAMFVLMAGDRPAAGAGDTPCTIATRGESPVAVACARGGRAEAKKVMKEAVNTAKKNGGKFTCDGCHKDIDSNDYQLKPNAREDFEKLLTVSGVRK